MPRFSTCPFFVTTPSFLSSRAKSRDLRFFSLKQISPKTLHRNLSSRPERRDLRFLPPQTNLTKNSPPATLSSRPKRRDLRFLPPQTNLTKNSPPQPCHPDRSGGTCGFFLPQTNLTKNSPPQPCHPDRSGGTCGFFLPQTNLTKNSPPHLVIPTEAEGPAVSFPSNKSHQRPTAPCHPDRSGGTYGFFPLKQISPKTPHPNLVIPTEAEGPAVSSPSNKSHQKLPTRNLVIPTEAEGPAVSSPSNKSHQKPPTRNLVIPTESEGPTVSSPSNKSHQKLPTQPCHPDRSGGTCGFFPLKQISPKTPHATLSSRPKRRDLRFLSPQTNLTKNAPRNLVIPTEAEGPAFGPGAQTTIKEPLQAS